MTEIPPAMKRRTFDPEEIQHLVDPYTHRPRLTLDRPTHRLGVEAVLASETQAASTDAKARMACVEAANAAISAVEAAGYEHAEPPKIEIGGFKVPPSETGRYILSARLSLVLLGKWS